MNRYFCIAVTTGKYDMAKKSHLETTLKKATIELLLLKLLDEGDMYGYQLSGELKRRSNGQYLEALRASYYGYMRVIDFLLHSREGDCYEPAQTGEALSQTDQTADSV